MIKIKSVQVTHLKPELIDVTSAADSDRTFHFTGKMFVDALVTFEKEGEVVGQCEGEFGFLIPSHYGFNYLDAENKIRELLSK